MLLCWLSAESAVQSFGSDNVCCPKRELVVMVLGLSFYPLEQAPNRVIYAMSKRGDSNERFNLFFGSWPKPRHKRAPLLPKHSSAD
jgi:hypothetical protein